MTTRTAIRLGLLAAAIGVFVLLLVRAWGRGIR